MDAPDFGPPLQRPAKISVCAGNGQIGDGRAVRPSEMHAQAGRTSTIEKHGCNNSGLSKPERGGDPALPVFSERRRTCRLALYHAKQGR